MTRIAGDVPEQLLSINCTAAAAAANQITMTGPLIAAIGGTFREKSYSRAALHHALGVAAALNAQTTMLDLRDFDLPMYRPDFALDDYKQEDREALTRFLDACYACDGLIWACPCYHGTVSGLFKNALDHIEYLSEGVPPYLTGKPVGLIAINDSKTFSAMSNSVHELRAWLAPTHVLLTKKDFDDELNVTDEGANRRITRLVQEVIGFVGFQGDR